MKVLFIHRYDYHEPIGIMMLSAYLKRKGHTTELLDLSFNKNYLKEIKRIKPDIISYSVLTVNYNYYYNINLKIKEQFNFFSVFGGPHTTFFTDFINNDGVDAICVGEGEEALAELADALENKKELNGIQNIFYKKEGEILKNELRFLNQNLDELPYPDRDLINKYKHYRYRTRVRTITSRGCPYNCSYCFNHSFKKLFKDKGTFLRRRSVDNVIGELLQLKSMYKPRNIEFHDDIFILDKEWLDEFAEKYKSQINIPYDASVRLELVNEDLVKKLKYSGCKCVHFGIESGNYAIRKDLLKRNISDDAIVAAALLFKKYDIITKPFNIVGLPGETLENVFETIQLNIKSKVTYAINTIYHPYPQTELADYAQQNAYFDGDLSKIDKSLFYGKSALKSPDIKKIIRLHYLFAFCVKYPFIIPFVKWCIKMPFDNFYRILFFLYRAYSVFFIYKQVSFREIFIFEHKTRQ